MSRLLKGNIICGWSYKVNRGGYLDELYNIARVSVHGGRDNEQYRDGTFSYHNVYRLNMLCVDFVTPHWHPPFALFSTNIYALSCFYTCI